MLLMIDNYDSFTYNVVQFLGELGAEVQVYRNDAITLDEIEAMAPDQIVLSSGPCTPDQAGSRWRWLSLQVKRRSLVFVLAIRVLVRLGGRIIRAAKVMHEAVSDPPSGDRGFSGVVQSADGHAVSFSGDRQSDPAGLS